MDERQHTNLGAITALNARRIEHIERALELIVRRQADAALADELQALAHVHRDDAAGSLYWRLARLARRAK